MDIEPSSKRRKFSDDKLSGVLIQGRPQGRPLSFLGCSEPIPSKKIEGTKETA
jgi:hypothetical protein